MIAIKSMKYMITYRIVPFTYLHIKFPFFSPLPFYFFRYFLFRIFLISHSSLSSSLSAIEKKNSSKHPPMYIHIQCRILFSLHSCVSGSWNSTIVVIISQIYCSYCISTPIIKARMKKEKKKPFHKSTWSPVPCRVIAFSISHYSWVCAGASLLSKKWDLPEKFSFTFVLTCTHMLILWRYDEDDLKSLTTFYVICLLILKSIVSAVWCDEKLHAWKHSFFMNEKLKFFLHAEHLPRARRVQYFFSSSFLTKIVIL